jgi:hypothetical protein
MSATNWTVVILHVTLILGLLALGFSAMSTNPAFIVPTWVPCLFFIMAGLFLLGLIAYLIYVKVSNRRKTESQDISAFKAGGRGKISVKNADLDGYDNVASAEEQSTIEIDGLTAKRKDADL